MSKISEQGYLQCCPIINKARLNNWFEFLQQAGENSSGNRGYQITTYGEAQLLKVNLTHFEDCPEFSLYACGDHYHCVIGSDVSEQDITLGIDLAQEAYNKLNSAPRKLFHWTSNVMLKGHMNKMYEVQESIRLDNEVCLQSSGAILKEESIFSLKSFEDAQRKSNGESVSSGGSIHKNIFNEIRVNIQTEGFTVEESQILAAEKLQQVMSYLSVNTNSEVSVSKPLMNRVISESDFEADRQFNHPESVKIDSEVIKSSYWNCYVKNSFLFRAYGVFNEAVAIEEKHPSIAQFAYMSAIETVGVELFPPIECQGVSGGKEHCDSCQKYTGSRRACLEALKLVLSDKDAREFRKQHYDLYRSKLTHEARLHGHETLAGNRQSPMLIPDERMKFGNQISSLRTITQKVLLQSLANKCSS